MRHGSLREIPVRQLQSASTGELFTKTRAVTEAMGITSFWVSHEELAPGRRSSSPHAHTKKDEMVVVLVGRPTVHVNGEARVLRAGEFVVFRAVEREVHWLVNETEEAVELLMVSSCPPDDVVEYR